MFYSSTSRNPWGSRILEAVKYKQSWEELFHCKDLERYYRGFQWNSTIDITAYKPYVLNIVKSTIKIKLATILFQNPEFLISPKPGKMNWNQDFAVQAAQIKQDALNTIAQNKNIYFAKNLKLAALDSFFRFGVIETGYAADWRNPNKKDQVMKSEEDSDISHDKDKVVEDLELPASESVYWKRVKARRFIVSCSDDEILENCHWSGYYSFMMKSTLENTKGIKMPKDYISNNYLAEYNDVLSNFKDKNNNRDVLMALQNGSICKVWHIWNHRSKENYLILDDCFEEIWQADYERLPFTDVKWDDDLEGYYPIPPVFDWLSPQNEINEAREQMRNYRRRFIRKFFAVKGKVDSTELDKMASNTDGEVITVKAPDAIGVLQNPDLGGAITQDLSASMNDLNLISGTSANVRGAVDRTTATESKIIDIRSQIRESVEQMDFTNFIGSCGREGLLQITERFSEGMWIKVTVDPGEEILGEIQANGPIFKYITAQDLDDGYDFDITINVVNATPAKMQEEQQNFFTFIEMLTKFPQLALSPKLTRETAYRCGYRNEAIIKEVQKAAQLRMMAQASQQAQQNVGSVNGQGATPESVNGSINANGNPNPLQEIMKQLKGKVGGNA